MKVLFFAFSVPLLVSIVESADKDFTLNLLRYGELRGFEMFISSAPKTMGTVRAKPGKIGYATTMLNYLVRIGGFKKNKQASSFFKTVIQRGLRKEDDDGQALYEQLVGHVFYGK